MGVMGESSAAVTVRRDGIGGGRVEMGREGVAIGNGEWSGIGAKLRSDVNDLARARFDVEDCDGMESGVGKSGGDDGDPGGRSRRLHGANVGVDSSSAARYRDDGDSDSSNGDLIILPALRRVTGGTSSTTGNNGGDRLRSNAPGILSSA